MTTLTIDDAHPWDSVHSTNPNITTMIIIMTVGTDMFPPLDMFPPNVEDLTYRMRRINDNADIAPLFPDFRTINPLIVPILPVGLTGLSFVSCKINDIRAVKECTMLNSITFIDCIFRNATIPELPNSIREISLLSERRYFIRNSLVNIPENLSSLTLSSNGDDPTNAELNFLNVSERTVSLLMKLVNKRITIQMDSDRRNSTLHRILNPHSGVNIDMTLNVNLPFSENMFQLYPILTIFESLVRRRINERKGVSILETRTNDGNQRINNPYIIREIEGYLGGKYNKRRRIKKKRTTRRSSITQKLRKKSRKRYINHFL
jgi:hypothetical protein